MFTRAQASKSGLAGMEEPADGPFGAASLVRPPSKEAVGKPESSPAEPAGPVSVPAIPMVVTTSGGGRGNSGPVGFPFPGISLGCPGGQAGPMSIEVSPRPPSEPISRTSDISVVDFEMLSIPWPVLCVQQKQCGRSAVIPFCMPDVDELI